MKNSNLHFSIKQLVLTAMMLAILVAAQFATKSMGQYVTGTLVNLILATSVILLGPLQAMVIAFSSPFFAFILGIGTPIIQIVPAIALGNLVYVVMIGWLIRNTKINHYVIVVVSAVIKFMVLYFVVVKLLLPTLGLPDQKVSVLSLSFSWPQLITALLGGTIAVRISPRIEKIIHR